MDNNTYKGKKIEFHILQSFPVTCLNRDDVGAPKTAMIGGVTRARVSSQAWKRQVRLSLRDFGITLGVRTKYVADLIGMYCKEFGANDEQAEESAKKISEALSKDTLHFFTEHEAESLAEYAQSLDFEAAAISDKQISKEHQKGLPKSFKNLEGLDIALFGRMVAQAAELNIEAAASFSHAISTHKVNNEVEFFTALDDRTETPGSSHMGSLEYNSATYYRYISLDLGQLVKTLGDDQELDRAIETFVKALYVAVPSARQTTQSGSNLWDYAKVYIRRGQRIQASFDRPVVAKGEGYLKPSISAMNDFLSAKEKMSGSLFGKIQELTWGEDENYSIDALIDDIKDAIRK